MNHLFLAVETSSTNCSVGLIKNDELIDSIELNDGYSHGEKLAVFVESLLSKNNVNIDDLSAVAVGEGPGSYTGLRIGVSFVKGLAFLSKVKLISINSLHSMVMQVLSLLEDVSSDALFIGAIDARRDEVYVGIYNSKGSLVKEIQPMIISEDSFSEYADNRNVFVLGSGAKKIKRIISFSHQFKFHFDVFPSAFGMQKIILDKYLVQQFEDVAYFEPFYLKDFVAGTPKKRNLLPD